MSNTAYQRATLRAVLCSVFTEMTRQLDAVDDAGMPEFAARVERMVRCQTKTEPARIVGGQEKKSMTPDQIARVCHEVNRAYCASQGDHSQPAWETAPEWQRKSAISGVQFTLANPDAKPSDSHESWLAEKRRDGWRYGPTKNPDTKEHPCFVPYDELPQEQRAKDYLFQAVVRALA